MNKIIAIRHDPGDSRERGTLGLEAAGDQVTEGRAAGQPMLKIHMPDRGAVRFGGKTVGLQFHPEDTRAMLEKWIGSRESNVTI